MSVAPHAHWPSGNNLVKDIEGAIMFKHILGGSLLLLGMLLGIVLTVMADMGFDEGRVPTGFLSGKDWLGLSGTAQASYAVGVIDGLDLGASLKPQGLFWINSCVTGMTSDQVRAMLKAELDARPGERDLPMVHRAMYQALWKACRHK
jgi:hypothetical protein